MISVDLLYRYDAYYYSSVIKQNAPFLALGPYRNASMLKLQHPVRSPFPPFAMSFEKQHLALNTHRSESWALVVLRS